MAFSRFSHLQMSLSHIVIAFKASVLFIVSFVSMGHCVVLTICSNACPSVHLNRSSMSVSDLVPDNAFRKLITFAVLH